MPLEATVCMLDNSEYAINSDIIPTRLEAAADAVKTIFKAKTNSNPESTCGLMTFAGKSPTVLVTPTTDEGKIHVSLQSIKPHGTPDLIAGLSVAGLALKHRQEKNQRQRAIVLLSSPLPATLTADELSRPGRKLKKNNVAVDVVLFGSEVEANEPRMRAFVSAVESGGNSRIIVVPGGVPGLLSDHIKQSDILAEEGFGSGVGGSAAAAGAGNAGGIPDAGGLEMDPNLDPELAMVRPATSIRVRPLPDTFCPSTQALRMSLQEEEARQAAATRQQPSSSAAPAQPNAAHVEGSEAGAPAAGAEGDSVMASVSADEELAQALAMSRGEDIEMDDGEGAPATATATGGAGGDEDLTEEEAIAKAIEMSMKENDKKS